MTKSFIILLLLLLSYGTITAQIQNHQESKVAPSWAIPELVTDRPDQTESSCTVPKNSLQVETGFIYESFKENNVEFVNWAIATTLLRYGVWENLELRLGSYYQHSNIQSDELQIDSTQSGLGPVSAGFKVYVVEEKGIRPEISILADLTLNTVGKLDYRPQYTYSTIKILASHSINDFISFGYNLGWGNDGESADGFFVYSAVIGFGISKKVGAFAEVYGNSRGGGLPNHKIDGGFTFMARHNLQMDVSAGTGIGGDVKMYFLNAGLSWRIPT